MKKILILPLLFLLLLPSVFAGYFDNWHQWLHIPPEYARAPDLIYFLLVPFLAVWAITWGILTRIKIFDNLSKVNMLLSLLFAVATVYYGWIFKLVHFMLAFGSTVSFIVFMVMFFVGTTLFAKRKIKGDWKGSNLKELKDSEKELKKKRGLLEDYEEELLDADDDERVGLEGKITKIRERVRKLETRIDKLRKEIETEQD